MNNKVKSKKLKLHFIGIGGSGMSAVALIAQSKGYEVSGCDKERSTSYLWALKKRKIKIYFGHHQDHIKHVDYVIATPALKFSGNENEEYKQSLKNGNLLMWDEFLNQFVLNTTQNICISGTHGKSTTTAWTGLLFEKAGMDPTVLVGAQVKEWNSNARAGKSELFVIESDEFSGKFLNYNPHTIVINNIEFDHPDYFKNEEEIISLFTKFIKLLPKNGNLIVNLDNDAICKILNKVGNMPQVNIYGYSLKGNNKYSFVKTLNANISKMTSSYCVFSVYCKELGINSVFRISLPGEHNVYNSLGVIILSKMFFVADDILRSTLINFNGIKRRMELVFDGRVKLYDDYAHHPTAIKETLKALRQKYPISNIIVVYEAHSYSRTKTLLKQYEGVFESADKVIVGPIFKARDTKTFGVSEKSIVKASVHKNIVSFSDPKNAIAEAVKSAQKNSVIIVMGAGKSYEWTEKIGKLLK